jgi:hypothetical protein
MRRELGVQANDTIIVECLSERDVQQFNQRDHVDRGTVAEGTEAFENTAFFSVISGTASPPEHEASTATNSESAPLGVGSPQPQQPVQEPLLEVEPEDEELVESESDAVLSELADDLKLADDDAPPRKHPRLCLVGILDSDEEEEGE